MVEVKNPVWPNMENSGDKNSLNSLDTYETLGLY